jgi:hypothetical protein
MELQEYSPESVPSVICQFCYCAVEPADKKACPECNSDYHQECWDDNGGCAVYGCTAAARPRIREDIETPASFWGREHKDCPACEKEILATALRCRHCGEVFKSAQPLSARELEEVGEADEQLPGMRKATVAILIFGVISFTAPLAALVGLFWYFPRRTVFRKLPPLNQALFWMGVIVGFGQTLFLVLTGVLTGLLGS